MKTIITIIASVISFSSIANQELISVSQLNKISTSSFEERVKKSDPQNYVKACISQISKELKNVAETKNLKVLDDKELNFDFAKCTQWKSGFSSSSMTDSELVKDIVLKDLLNKGFSITQSGSKDQYKISW